MPPPIPVLLLTFPQMDLLDFAGPLETLSHARLPSDNSRLFSFTIAAATPTITTSQGVTLSRDISLSEARASLAQYAILVVPGASWDTTEALLGAETGGESGGESGLVGVVRAFAGLPGKTGVEAQGKGVQRTIMSVCAGAFFLGAAGLLRGKVVTTHWSILDKLVEVGGAERAVRKRYVDAGEVGDGVGLIMGGGITSGLDAGLYLVEKLGGREMARVVMEVMDYEWRREE